LFEPSTWLAVNNSNNDRAVDNNMNLPEQQRSLVHHHQSQLSGQIDIMISHDWPRGITSYGDVGQLLRYKKHLAPDIQSGELGMMHQRRRCIVIVVGTLLIAECGHACTDVYRFTGMSASVAKPQTVVLLCCAFALPLSGRGTA
jgi:hypothetical protein